MRPIVRLRREIAARFGRKPCRLNLQNPVVSFCFDDFPRSALLIGGEILYKHGIHATYYCAMGLAGQQRAGDKIFQRSDLEQLLRAQHELACHSFGHESCYTLSGSQLRRSCQKNQDAVREALGPYRLRNFAYPFGHVTLSAKTTVSSVYDSCRTTIGGINTLEVDLAYVHANALYSRLGTEGVRAYIAQNSLQNGWLVFYTHDVVSEPTIYGCTPKYFREVLSMVLDSGADILSMAEAVEKFYQPE